jgi:hypothetical protein
MHYSIGTRYTSDTTNTLLLKWHSSLEDLACCWRPELVQVVVLVKVKVEVTVRLTVSQSVCLSIEHPCGTCDQALLPVRIMLYEICGLASVGHPLWRQDGSAICSVITQCSESLRTRNHTLLSHLRLPQPGGPGSRIYISQEEDGSVIPPGTGFPLRRLAGL